MNNMLQISDFFQCVEALRYCIRHLEVTRENACLNIREALKKVQASPEQFRACWFSLIQKSIGVAA
jgi:hypothetical protein